MAIQIPTGVRVGPAAGPAPAPRPEADRVRDAGRQFEALFLEVLLRQMRSAARSLGGEQRRFAADLYDGWLEQQLAQRLVAGGGIGLADALSRALQLRYNEEDAVHG